MAIQVLKSDIKFKHETGQGVEYSSPLDFLIVDQGSTYSEKWDSVIQTKVNSINNNLTTINNFCQGYTTNKKYKIGDYVYYNDYVYCCNKDMPVNSTTWSNDKKYFQRVTISNQLTKLFDEKLNIPQNGTPGQVLTKTLYSTQWRDFPSDDALAPIVAQAIAAWMNENLSIPESQSYILDSSLTQETAAAQASATGDAINSLIKISQNQPIEEFNKIWIHEIQGGTSVPTQEDLQNIIAPAYTIETSYKEGDYILYNGAMYCITANINAEENTTWDDVSKKQINVGEQISNLNDQIEIIKNGETSIDLTKYEVINCTISSTNTILKSGNSYKSYQIPADMYGSIIITASSRNTMVSFLKTAIPNDISNGTNIIDYFATGENRRHIINAGDTQEFLLSDDVKYFFITKNSGGNDYAPANITVKTRIESKLSNIDTSNIVNFYEAVSTIIEDNVTETKIDATLMHSNEAADAKAVGDAIGDLKSAVSNIPKSIYSIVSGTESSALYDKRGTELTASTYLMSEAFSVTPTEKGVAIEKIIVPVRTSEDNVAVKVSLADKYTSDYNALASVTVTAGTTQTYAELPVNMVLSLNTEYWVRLDCDTRSIAYRGSDSNDYSNEYYEFGITRFAGINHNNGSTSATIKFYGAIYGVNLNELNDADVVRTDTNAQGLTDTEKSNARTNIDVPSNGDLHSLQVSVNGMAGYIGSVVDATNDADLEDGHIIQASNGRRATRAGYSSSGFIDVQGYEKVKVMMPVIMDATTAIGLAFYSEAVTPTDDNNTFVPGGNYVKRNQPNLGCELREFDVPETANYMRTTWFSSDNTSASSFYNRFSVILSKSGTIKNDIDKNTENIAGLQAAKNALAGIGGSIVYDHRNNNLTASTLLTSQAFSITPTRYGVALDKIIVPVRTSEDHVSVRVSLADSNLETYTEFAGVTVTGGTELTYAELTVNQALLPGVEYWLRLDCDTRSIRYGANEADFSNAFYIFGNVKYSTSGHNNTTNSSTMRLWGAIYAVNLYDYQNVLDGEIPSYYENTDLSLYETAAVIGDSYSSGAIYSVPGATGGRHNNMAWLKILGRKCGFDATLYTNPGWATTDFLDPANTQYGITALLNDTPKNLYFIMLGINTESGTTGDATQDCNVADYTQNDDSTFCGRYGIIIGKIKEHAPNAMIVCIVPPMGAGRHQAIVDVAAVYGVPAIKTLDDPYFTSAFYNDNLSQGHPVGITYAGMANAIARLYSRCVQENSAYFKVYTGDD